MYPLRPTTHVWPVEIHENPTLSGRWAAMEEMDQRAAPILPNKYGNDTSRRPACKWPRRRYLIFYILWKINANQNISSRNFNIEFCTYVWIEIWYSWEKRRPSLRVYRRGRRCWRYRYRCVVSSPTNQRRRAHSPISNQKIIITSNQSFVSSR